MAPSDEGHFVEHLACGAAAAAGTEEEGSGSGEEAGSLPGSEVEEAVRVLLEGLGEDCDREGLRRTPLRVAKALRYATKGYKQEVEDIVQGALFPEAGLDNKTGYAGGTGGLVLVRDIDLFSHCESCLLPFGIRCHVGYIPSGQRVVGLSKLSRVADVFAKRLQEPQRLADEVCAALHSSIKPAGVAVALQCWHIESPESLRCYSTPRKQSKLGMERWARTSVCSRSGLFVEGNASLWADFLLLLKLGGISFEGSHTRQTSPLPWCPYRSLGGPHCNGNGTRIPLNGSRLPVKQETSQDNMVEAVASILNALGEDPCRKELVGTPSRFVHWLMNFRRRSSQTKPNGLNLSRNGVDRNIPNGDAGGNYEIRSELNLPFCALCEHHLLPFYGVVHVGYFDAQEGGRSLDRSALQSLVHYYGFHLQVQERLTRQVAEAVHAISGVGVMVLVEASHICMISRGIEKVDSNTTTIAVTGRFSSDLKAKAAFLQTLAENAASEK